MNKVYHEVHWMNDSTGERGVYARTVGGSQDILSKAWAYALFLQRHYLNRRFWVKTRPVLAKPLEAA